MDFLRRGDLYKEPALDVNRMRIKEKGTLGGLFVTLCGVLVTVMLIIYSNSYYRDYFALDISSSSDHVKVGFNNDNSIKLMAHGFGQAAGERIVQGTSVNIDRLYASTCWFFIAPHTALNLRT